MWDGCPQPSAFLQLEGVRRALGSAERTATMANFLVFHTGEKICGSFGTVEYPIGGYSGRLTAVWKSCEIVI